MDWLNTAQQRSPILGSMRISGAFLAEKVEAVDNKLNVKGGVISNFRVGRDRQAQFDIVVLTQGDTEDTGGDDRLVVIEVAPPDGGEPLHMHRELPMNLTNADVGFACFQFRLTLNLNGRWVVKMSGAAGDIALPLTVSGPR
ncbi:hypothetical protein [Mycobacterium sp.]|uniref:hypothetical protein n=1 Tax=Mycobacterium sp. TaxID=1785 RepID=UPI0031DC93EA